MFRNVFIGHIIRLGSIQLVRLFTDHSRHPYTSETSDFQEIPEKNVTKLQLNQIGICPGGNHFKIIMAWEYDSPQNIKVPCKIGKMNNHIPFIHGLILLVPDHLQ